MENTEMKFNKNYRLDNGDLVQRVEIYEDHKTMYEATFGKKYPIVLTKKGFYMN